MVSAVILETEKFCGLFELGRDGIVLYSRIEGDDRVPDMTGRNFFTEVAPFQNVSEFQQRLGKFSQGSLQADSFQFTCQYDDGPLPIKVLLARLHSKAEERTESLLVHIRKA